MLDRGASHHRQQIVVLEQARHCVVIRGSASVPSDQAIFDCSLGLLLTLQLLTQDWEPHEGSP